MSGVTKMDTLLMISQDARKFMQRLGPIAVTTSRSHELSPHHILAIPLPQPITDLFVARGLPPVVAEKFNKVFIDHASSLKEVYEDNHRQAVQSCIADGSFQHHDVDAFIAASQSAYIRRYKEDLKTWQAKVDEISHRQTHSMEDKTFGPGQMLDRRPSFKNGVPVLETAFAVNAYPSRADKESLAHETGMEYKQINIWFQNRRARSKKEGISLHRTATFATQLGTPSRAVFSPSPEPYYTDSCADEGGKHSSEVYVRHNAKRSADLFALIERPTHTFPTPYPPSYDEDPFPVRSGTGSFRTIWFPKRSTELIQRPTVNVDHLVSQMAGLSLSSDTSTSQARPVPSFTFVVPRAPLPALIRTATTSSRAQPLATFVSAVGSSSVPGPKDTRKLYRVLPAHLPRLPIGKPPSLSLSSVGASSSSVPFHSRNSAAGRSRRSTRSPSPSHSSRSSSLSSLASSLNSSSSWSTVSSGGPLTPSVSPRFETLSVVNDSPSTSTAFYVQELPDGVHVSSSFC